MTLIITDSVADKARGQGLERKVPEVIIELYPHKELRQAWRTHAKMNLIYSNLQSSPKRDAMLPRRIHRTGSLSERREVLRRASPEGMKLIVPSKTDKAVTWRNTRSVQTHCRQMQQATDSAWILELSHDRLRIRAQHYKLIMEAAMKGMVWIDILKMGCLAY